MRNQQTRPASVQSDLRNASEAALQSVPDARAIFWISPHSLRQRLVALLLQNPGRVSRKMLKLMFVNL
jgi:hypothetical protein